MIQPVLGEWHPHILARLGEEELADWQAGRNATYQLAALTVRARSSCRRIAVRLSSYLHRANADAAERRSAKRRLQHGYRGSKPSLPE